MATTHDLKTLPAYYDAVERGEKTFEVRRDDRGFQKDDILRLKRFEPGKGYTLHDPGNRQWPQEHTDLDYEARTLERRVLWILTGGQFGVEPGYVVLSLGPVGAPADAPGRTREG